MREQQKIFLGAALLLITAVFFLTSHKTKPQAKPPENLTETEFFEEPSVARYPNPVLPKVLGVEIPIGKTVRVPILMYHHIGFVSEKDLNNHVATDLTVSASDFESQVKYFHDKGFESVSLKDVLDSLENEKALPAHPIVFTFDDGFKDALTNGVEILQKYNYVGTFAIATELLGRPTYGVWDDVVTAQKQGMEVVSHTENHLDLTNPIYSADDLHREIFGSKQTLEEKLGVPVDFFVYPYGRHDAKVEQLVKDAGYKMAFTTAFGENIGENDLLFEPRVRVHGQDGLEKLKRVFEPKRQTAPIPTNP